MMASPLHDRFRAPEDDRGIGPVAMPLVGRLDADRLLAIPEPWRATLMSMERVGQPLPFNRSAVNLFDLSARMSVAFASCEFDFSRCRTLVAELAQMALVRVTWIYDEGGLVAADCRPVGSWLMDHLEQRARHSSVLAAPRRRDRTEVAR